MASARVENLRIAVASAYPGDRWKERVKYMPDNQIIAIYNHFVRDGVFEKIRTPKKPSDGCRQLTLWDYGIDPAGGGKSA